MKEKVVKRGRERLRKNASDNLINDGDRGHKSGEETPYWNELPEFFKIYVPALCSNSMRIPPVFFKNFGKNISTNVTLRISSGLSWLVQMHRICEHWFLQQGWPEFVQENSIADGDFLLFSYAGDSIFSVKVFARNGCRKRINKTSMIDKKPAENIHAREESEPVYLENNDHNRATGRYASPKHSREKNLSFQVVVRKYNLRYSCMNIPSLFCRNHMSRVRAMGSGTRAPLWIRNKSWDVALAVACDRILFSKGWTKFARDNSLQIGNLCTFHLMDANDLSFRVTISR